jgi:hypothetical protein
MTKYFSYILTCVVALTPLPAWAEIKVSDKHGVFLGYLMSDSDFWNNLTVRLFVPKINKFVAYTYYPSKTLKIQSTPLFYSEAGCNGTAYIDVSYTPFNEIRLREGAKGLFVGDVNTLQYFSYKSRTDGLLCLNTSNVIWAMKAMALPDGTVPLEIGYERFPLKFELESGRSATYLPIPTGESTN